MKFLSLFNVLIASTIMSASTFAETTKPNVIIIYADDLGPGMLSCYGQELIQTPHIDALARQGMRFNNFYGHNVCAPARANLLTGLHDGHLFSPNKGGLSIKLQRGDISQEEFDAKLDAVYEERRDVSYIGHMARQAGYHTSYFGKLGIGYSENHDLMKLYGFDHYIGLYDSVVCWSFYPEFYWDNGTKVPLPTNPKFKEDAPQCPLIGKEDMTYTEDIWLGEALTYLEQKKDEPFFMIYSTQLPHGPASIAPKDHVYKDHEAWSPKERVYASMINKLDRSVGSILSKLQELGLEENTVLIFTGDNGHESSYYTDPLGPSTRKGLFWDGHHWGEDVFEGSLNLRGIKRYNFQGGIRVPTIIRWPGNIKPGSTTDFAAATYDLFATCADIMGSEKEYATDGLSIKNELLGQPQETHEFLYWGNNTGAGRDALIKGPWKIVNEMDIEKSDPEKMQRVYKWALYNIQDDPFEKVDLIDQYPDVFQDLFKTIPQ